MMTTIHFAKNHGGPLHYFGNLFLSCDALGHMHSDCNWLKELFSIIQFNTHGKKYKRCIEPFSGCASWSIAAMELGLADQYVINDSDKTLIQTLNLIKDKPHLIKTRYALLEQEFEHSPDKKSYFLKTLAAYNHVADNEEKAQLLPFIINHSWSGILFHNSKREILYHEATPCSGKPQEQFLETASLPIERFHAEVDRISELFNAHHVVFKSGDFLDVLADIGPDDFIALDPPYPENERSITEKAGMYTELYSPKRLHERLKQLINKMEHEGINYYMTYGFYNPQFYEYVLLDSMQNPGNYFRGIGYERCAFGTGLNQIYFSSKFSIPAHLKTKIIPANKILKGDSTTTPKEALRQYKEQCFILSDLPTST